MSNTDAEQARQQCRPAAFNVGEVGGGSPGSPPPVHSHADEPWAVYYLHQNPGWAAPRDEYSKWRLGGSRKWTSIATWTLREAARGQYVATYGPDLERWPERHVTVVVFPTNLPTAVCIECLWLDGSHWRTAVPEQQDVCTPPKRNSLVSMTNLVHRAATSCSVEGRLLSRSSSSLLSTQTVGRLSLCRWRRRWTS